MQLSKEQLAAFAEVRKVTCNRIKNHCSTFTDEMLADKSLFQLVTLLHLLVGHHNYLGTYTCTCRTRLRLERSSAKDRVFGASQR